MELELAPKLWDVSISHASLTVVPNASYQWLFECPSLSFFFKLEESSDQHLQDDLWGTVNLKLQRCSLSLEKLRLLFHCFVVFDTG